MSAFYWQAKELWGTGRQPALWEAQIIDSALQELEGLTRDDEQKLLELSDRLSKQFLEKVSESSLKNCFTRLHKAIKIHFSPESGRLTQANSIIHPTKKEPIHISLLLIDTPQEIKDKNNELHGESLEWKHNNVAYLNNPEAIIERGRELLERAIEAHKTGEFCNYRDLATALCLLAGLRPVEALRDAVLEPKTQFSVVMADGQAKTRGEERIYEMPTLINADRVLEGYRILREIFDASNLNDNEIQSFKNGVRDCVIQNFKDLVPTLQRLKGEKQVNSQRLRAVYDAIAVFYYCPAKVKDFVFVKAINGHKPQKGRSDAAMHYLDYQIADAVIARYNGKRQGVKLGEPGVEVLEQFKDKAPKAPTKPLPQPVLEPNTTIIKPAHLRAYPTDRKRLQKLAQKFNTTNQPDTLNCALSLAEIALGLAEQLNIELTSEAFEAAISHLIKPEPETETEPNPESKSAPDTLPEPEPEALPKPSSDIQVESSQSEIQSPPQSDQTSEPQPVSSPPQSEEMAQAWKAIAQLTATVTPLAAAVTRLTEKLEGQMTRSTSTSSAVSKKRTSNQAPAHNSQTATAQVGQTPVTQESPKQQESLSKINAYIDAIMKFNDSLPDEHHKDKWFIGVSALKRLVTSNQNVIQRVLNERAEEIAKHHSHHQLGEKHNSKGRFAPKINEVVKL